MTRKEMHPFGEFRMDTVAQPIRSREYAEKCAEIMARMTGEPCEVEPRGMNHWYIMRAVTGGKWIRA
jgi:hypothetical protein